MRKFLFFVPFALVLLFFTSCIARTDNFMQMPIVYNCSVGLVETHNDWKDAELRQGVETIEMKRISKPADEDENDFTSTVFGNSEHNAYLTVSYYEVSLVVDGSHYACTPLH